MTHSMLAVDLHRLDHYGHLKPYRPLLAEPQVLALPLVPRLGPLLQPAMQK